jgi:hypothetical protein
MRRRLAQSVFALAIVGGVVGGGVAAHASSPKNVEKVKQATAKFHSVSRAEKAGYGRFVDVNGVACIDMPGMGAMGIHYVNGDLVGDGKISLRHPEAMVYAPGKHGSLHLAAVEYVVTKDQWLANHDGPPKLFGRTFNFTDAPNRYGLPPFYSLHAWVWKRNPAGTFSMWNPNVRCSCTHKATMTATM